MKIEEEKQAFLRRIGREISRLKRRRKKILGDLEEAGKAGLWQRRGDLLKSFFSSLRKGIASLRVTDPQTGAAEEIPLDPFRSPAQNLETIYARAKKLRRKERAAGGRLRETDAEIADREGRRSWIEALEGEELREALAAERPPEAPPSVRRKAARVAGTRFVLETGSMLLVGRNAAENDRIVKTAGKGSDFWFHARDYPGGHVLLLLPRGREPTPEEIRTAATLAFLHSEARRDAGAEVIYTRKKNVRPIRRHPGQVTYTKVKSIRAVPDPALPLRPG